MLHRLLAAWDMQPAASDARTPPAAAQAAVDPVPGLPASAPLVGTTGFAQLLAAMRALPRRAGRTAAAAPASLIVHVPLADDGHCTLRLCLLGTRLFLYIATEDPALAAALTATRRAMALQCIRCGLSLAGFVVDHVAAVAAAPRPRVAATA